MTYVLRLGERPGHGWPMRNEEGDRVYESREAAKARAEHFEKGPLAWQGDTARTLDGKSYWTVEELPSAGGVLLIPL